jgi:DNA-binding GntR family transcriptional regulator
VDKFDPDPEIRGYVFVRLADYVMAEVAAGRISVGGRLPNEREMAQKYGVSHGTVRRTLELLRERGVAETYPSKGTFVIAATAGPNGADAQKGTSGAGQ